MLIDLLDRAKRDRENAKRARKVGAGVAVTARYLWSVTKWLLALLGIGLLAVVWILFSILWQPLRGK